MEFGVLGVIDHAAGQSHLTIFTYNSFGELTPSGGAITLGVPNANGVAIMSDRPQTTRHAVRGIVHRPDAQLVLVDTPGFHKPRTLLGERLNDVVRSTLTRTIGRIGFGSGMMRS